MKVENIITDSLGFPLNVKIVLDKFKTRGKHRTFEDETGKVSKDSPHTLEIDSELNLDELAEVAAHEAYHLFYSIRHLITVDEETQATVFGQLVKKIVALALP